MQQDRATGVRDDPVVLQRPCRQQDPQCCGHRLSFGGEFARFHPHLHAIVLEWGFNGKGRFVHIPRLDLGTLSQYFRASMVDFFLQRQLLNERLAKNMLQWSHSSFSVDVRIPAGCSKTREALSLYIARAPPLLPHQRQAVQRHRLHRGTAPTRPSPPINPPLWTVLFPLPLYVAAQTAPGAPGPRGVEAGSRSAGCASQQSRRPAVRPSLGVLPRVPRSMGPADREGLRGRSLDLPPLWFPDAHPGGDHRTPAGAQDPASPDQDRESAAGVGPGLLELNPFPPCQPRIGPSPLTLKVPQLGFMIRPMCLYPCVAPCPTHLLPSQSPLPPQEATGSPVPAPARSPKRRANRHPDL